VLQQPCNTPQEAIAAGGVAFVAGTAATTIAITIAKATVSVCSMDGW
jgi:hypothetical protein